MFRKKFKILMLTLCLGFFFTLSVFAQAQTPITSTNDTMDVGISMSFEGHQLTMTSYDDIRLNGKKLYMSTKINAHFIGFGGKVGNSSMSLHHGIERLFLDTIGECLWVRGLDVGIPMNSLGSIMKPQPPYSPFESAKRVYLQVDDTSGIFKKDAFEFSNGILKSPLGSFHIDSSYFFWDKNPEEVAWVEVYGGTVKKVCSWSEDAIGECMIMNSTTSNIVQVAESGEITGKYIYYTTGSIKGNKLLVKSKRYIFGSKISFKFTKKYVLTIEQISIIRSQNPTVWISEPNPDAHIDEVGFGVQTFLPNGEAHITSPNRRR